MSIRSAAVRAARGVEVLARRLRIRWSPPTTDAPGSDRNDWAFHRRTGLMDYPHLLFWTPEDPPQSFVRHDVPAGERALVAHALLRGWHVIACAGHANCRICGEALGSSDMAVHGMIYPQKAEHYLIEHDVWTPGCDELLRRLQTRSRT